MHLEHASAKFSPSKINITVLTAYNVTWSHLFLIDFRFFFDRTRENPVIFNTINLVRLVVWNSE